MTDIPIKIQFVKSLHNLKPSRVIVLKPDNATEFQLYVTDKTGIPFPIKDDTVSGAIASIINTDGNLTISGASNKIINLSASIVSTINSAIQSGDNISSLTNDAGYITSADIPDTKSEFNSQLTDGDFLFVGDITQYTNEDAQDAIGNILTDTSTVNLEYNDLTNQITAEVQANSITANELSDTIPVSEFINDTNYQENVLETLTSVGGSLQVGVNISKNINLEVVQATESQLGGGQIVTQAIIEDETTTDDTKTVTAKKFWQGWTKGLTLSAFFNAVRGTLLTGLSFVSSRITSSDSILSALGKLQRQVSELQATRFISGNGVSINGVDNTKFDIQVVGKIVDPSTFVEIDINVNLTSQTATYIATQPESYVWVNSSNAVVQSLTPPTPDLSDSIVGYWVLVHSNLTNINLINSFPYYTDGVATKVSQILNFIGFSKYPNTNIPTAGTAGTRIQHTGGYAIKAGLGNTTKRPILNLIGQVDPSNMEMRHRNGVFSSGVQDIDVTNYNPVGSTVSALANNKFTAHKIWKFASGLIRIQYGQKEYANYNEAIAGINVDTFEDEGNAFRNGLHIGWLVFKKGTSWGIGGTGIDGQDYKFIDVKSNGSTGGLTPTMQASYDVSTQPQIVTSTSKGAVQYQGGTGVDTDHIWEGKNNAGVVTSWVAADGSSSFGGGITTTVTTITSANLTRQDETGLIAYLNGLPSFNVPTNDIRIYSVSDTGQKFELLLHGVNIGSGETPLTESDVQEIEPIDFATLFPIHYWYQATGLALSTIGTNPISTSGAASNTYTNPFSYYRLQSAATAGTSIFAREASFGRVKQNQGYWYEARIKIADASLITDARGFFGFKSTSLIGNVEPSTTGMGLILAHDSTDTQLQLMHAETLGTMSKIPLGANFPIVQNGEYHITFYRMPNSSDTFWKIHNYGNGATVEGVVTNNPSIITIYNYRNNNTSNLACGFEIQRIKLYVSD